MMEGLVDCCCLLVGLLVSWLIVWSFHIRSLLCPPPPLSHLNTL